MLMYNTLQRDVDSYRKFYSEASQRLQEIKLAQAQKTSNIKIVEKALVPLHPLSSRTTLKMVLSVIIGCSIGVGFAFVFSNGFSNIHWPLHIALTSVTCNMKCSYFSHYLRQISIRLLKRNDFFIRLRCICPKFAREMWKLG